MSETHRPYAKNVPGPFYVVDSCCTACDVPLLYAPGLFEYDRTDGTNHCYVKRQPNTHDEVNDMLRAAWAAEFQCIRYRGQDPDILRRLGELGEPQLCDVAPPANVTPVFRNHVTFDAVSPHAESMTPQDLALAFQEYLRSLDTTWRKHEFTPILVEQKSAAFSYSWFESNFHPIELLVVDLPECRWLLRHSPIEKPGSRAVSNDVSDWLKKERGFGHVRWYTADQWSGARHWQATPW